MPTYEYRCGACGHAFEKFQSINDDPVKECPECGGDSAERIISSGAGLIFRGSGFYATDYRKGSGGSGEEGRPSGGEDGSAGSGDGSSSEDGSGSAGGAAGDADV